MYDLVVIGGGINGCGCAADAALRGLSVLLCEADDLASKTSSSSSKLIHGGLRYLEQYDFSLVKKSLDEQQNLLELAPHLVHPQSFVLPYEQHERPVWVLRTGLFIYDHLSANNTLPNSSFVTRDDSPTFFDPLEKSIKKGFVFYDCKTDDARLTIVNALQAANFGAEIKPRLKLIKATVVDKHWELTLQAKDSSIQVIKARAIINASGPWVPEVNQLLKIDLNHTISLVKGSHIVVHKLYEGDHAYLLQHDDGRIVFVIPYFGHTMIGTTDVAYNDDLKYLSIEPDEIDYLTQLVKHYFNTTCDSKDIITSWSGVRPLLANQDLTPTKLSRDYAYQFSTNPAPAVTIYGGKLTTYRQLAKEVIDELKAVFNDLCTSKTGTTKLPGANYNDYDFKHYKEFAKDKYHWLSEELFAHYISTYGTLMEQILTNCKNMSDLGKSFSQLLYQVEVDYLCDKEWAHNAEDILWRRTKLGLSMDMEEQHLLMNYLQAKFHNHATKAWRAQ